MHQHHTSPLWRFCDSAAAYIHSSSLTHLLTCVSKVPWRPCLYRRTCNCSICLQVSVSVTATSHRRSTRVSVLRWARPEGYFQRVHYSPSRYAYIYWICLRCGPSTTKIFLLTFLQKHSTHGAVLLYSTRCRFRPENAEATFISLNLTISYVMQMFNLRSKATSYPAYWVKSTARYQTKNQRKIHWNKKNDEQYHTKCSMSCL